MTRKDYYSPGEIRFTRAETVWLIQNLTTLRSGQWPPEASGYTDTGGRRGRSHKAPFQTAAEYYAEITDRLEKCGRDGLMLEAVECWGKSEESMAKYFGLTDWFVKKSLKRALNYVASGPARRWHNTRKRKGQTYEQYRTRKNIPASSK